METFLHSVASVAIILLLTATGYFCAAKGWMHGSSKAFLSKFLMNIIIPCNCIYGIRGNLTKDMLIGAMPLLLSVFLSISLDFILAAALARILRLPRKRIGVFIQMCALSNTLFIGLPMCTELFGNACTPYVMLFYFVSSVFTQTLSNALIRWSGDGEPFSGKMLLNFLKLPNTIALLVSFALVLLDVQVPSLILSYTKYMSNAVTPLALLLTGYIIYEIGLKHLHIDRDLAVAMLFRFLLAPLICYWLCTAFHIEGLALNVCMVQAAMPVVTQTVVASAEYGADEQFAAQGAALSTLACFVVIPVLMMLL